MIGEHIPNSLRRNQPSYSFGLKQDFYEKKPPIISKEHLIDFISKDSPGVGTYSPEMSQQKLSKISHLWTIPQDRRFKGPGSEVANNEK